ncbi:hypothetical protein KP509_06G049900 [Ceratopteris richardii]|uniref:TRM5/TYW2-like N-terminal domain-containing protein n=1 Tax=Ceratopteris richardii TaxID=49495 RepID=A0A8T2UNJ7_CERRI|nr:hypothetical protein KP509_06G049900 [Ceratopteris richardii]
MHAITGMKSHWLLDVRIQTCKPHIQWNPSVHSQLKHFSCDALHFEYENQPFFEEGKRLSSRLLDSLRLNDDDLPRDSFLSQHLVSKEHLKRVLHVPGERKRTKRTKKHQPVGRVSSENSDDYDLKDHELFEFDVVSLHDVDAGDESPENVLWKLNNFSSMSKNYHSKSLRDRNISANKNIFAQMELDEQSPALDPGDSDCNIAKIDHLNVINVPIESPEIEKQVINPFKQTEVTQKTTELTSLKVLNLENGVDGADTHRTCKDWFMSGNVQDEGSNIVSLNSQGKGDCQLQLHKSCPLGKLFDPLQFARIYNLVALRVPLAESKTLAYRLRGHLLNWPRISNIARVEGDDMGWDRGILWSENVNSIEDSVFKAVYGTQPLSGCLTKRTNSAKLLNSHQYSFLDHMSKPDMKALQQMKGPRDKESAKKKQHSKRQYTIKLGNSDGIQKLNPGINCWKGPFRLLLLDPRYAQQYELPMAVQMLLNEHIGHGKRQRRREVVPCNLIIFYNYWSMGQIIRYLLPKEVISPLQIKHLGHIALLQLDNAYSSVKHLLGRVILDKHQPKVKTVVNKCEPLEDCGHPSLEILAGNHSVVTSIIENDMQFLVNLSTVKNTVK